MRCGLNAGLNMSDRTSKSGRRTCGRRGGRRSPRCPASFPIGEDRGCDHDGDAPRLPERQFDLERLLRRSDEMARENGPGGRGGGARHTAVRVLDERLGPVTLASCVCRRRRRRRDRTEGGGGNCAYLERKRLPDSVAYQYIIRLSFQSGLLVRFL